MAKSEQDDTLSRTEDRPESDEALLSGQVEAVELVASGAPLPEVLARLTQIVESQSGGEALASILLLDPQSRTLHNGASPSLPQSYLDQIEGIGVREGLGTCADAAARNCVVVTQSIADAESWTGLAHLPVGIGLKAAWSMPITTSGEVLGTFGTYFRVERSPTPREQKLVQVLSEIASLAIIRDRSHKALLASEALARDEARALETTNRIGQSLSRELSLNSLVQALTDEATELTGAEFGSFFYNVLDDSGESYMLYTLSGAPIEAFNKFPMPRNTQVFDHTFRGEGVMRSDDITQDPRYGKNPPYNGMPEGHLPVRSYLAVPILSHSGDVLGGLFFGHSQVGVFTPRHERMLLGIASQAAVAMDNARLYERLSRVNADLERRVNERTAALQEAYRELEGFTYCVSHDLRGPLRAIHSTSMILREDFADSLPPEAIRHLDRQAIAAKRMGVLIDELLKLSRLSRQELKPAPFSLSDLAADVVADLNQNPGIPAPIAIQIQPGLEAVGDTRLIRLALQNLIENAAKFSPEGGTITVGKRDGRFFVEDQGIGFDPQYAHKVFLPFERLVREDEFPGSGIGLANVQRIIQRHGGQIHAEGRPGAGATFYFTLS